MRGPLDSSAHGGLVHLAAVAMRYGDASACITDKELFVRSD
jgi:hypothetical protein